MVKEPIEEKENSIDIKEVIKLTNQLKGLIEETSKLIEEVRSYEEFSKITEWIDNNQDLLKDCKLNLNRENKSIIFDGFKKTLKDLSKKAKEKYNMMESLPSLLQWALDGNMFVEYICNTIMEDEDKLRINKEWKDLVYYPRHIPFYSKDKKIIFSLSLVYNDEYSDEPIISFSFSEIAIKANGKSFWIIRRLLDCATIKPKVVYFYNDEEDKITFYTPKMGINVTFGPGEIKSIVDLY